ncbi:uncharacterized protein LOC126845558 [Adelges cooleyi]|uniref:uncharacterized protein LOC126845558 n=1 Tax=Adelges cooleyi TaxID=133065 RepID=UPI00217F5665|nr:uncharacterized protein LOC126845558 [Adelges cooleyi]
MDFKRTLFLSSISFVILAINSAVNGMEGNVAESNYSTPPEDIPEDDGYTTPTEEIQGANKRHTGPPPTPHRPGQTLTTPPVVQTGVPEIKRESKNVINLLKEREIKTEQELKKRIIRATESDRLMMELDLCNKEAQLKKAKDKAETSGSTSN